jgi:flagellar biosynthesis protein FliQ
MEDVVLRFARQSLMIVLIVSAPPLLCAFLIGLLINIFQAVTQLQEQTLSYVPKIIAVFLTLMALLPWMIAQIVSLSRSILEFIPMISALSR